MTSGKSVQINNQKHCKRHFAKLCAKTFDNQKKWILLLGKNNLSKLTPEEKERINRQIAIEER